MIALYEARLLEVRRQIFATDSAVEETISSRITKPPQRTPDVEKRSLLMSHFGAEISQHILIRDGTVALR